MGGKEDIAYKNCQLMMEKFKELNIAFNLRVSIPADTWPVWRNNLLTVLKPLLFKND